MEADSYTARAYPGFGRILISASSAITTTAISARQTALRASTSMITTRPRRPEPEMRAATTCPFDPQTGFVDCTTATDADAAAAAAAAADCR